MKIGPFNVSFKQQEPVKEPVADQEVSYAEDALYQRGDITKYNPDDLIGKKGFAIYRKMMLDEQVKAVVRFKRDSITSREYILEVDREQLSEEEADRRVAITQNMLDRVEGSFTDKLNGILSSMYQGFSLTEKVFKQFEHEGLTYWGLDRLKLKPFDTFEFIVDIYGNIIRTVQKISGQEIKININKFIHFVHNPDYDEQYGQSELREAYRAWFSKDMAITFWNMWLERHASGYKWIQPREGKTLTKPSTEYTDLQNVLNRSVNGNGMILPGKVEMHVEYPANNVAFKDAIEHHDLAIAKALLVPNLMGITPSGQTGSFSQSDTQLKAFAWTTNADTKRLEEAINEQMLRELGEMNFVDDYWPRFKFQPMNEDQIKTLIETWNGLLEKGGAKASESDEAYVRELLGFPNRAEEDKLLDEGGEDATDDNETNSRVPKTRRENKKVVEEEDETIQGKKAANIVYAQFARDKAAKRVDGLVLGKASEVLEKENSDEIALSLYNITDEWMDRFRVVYPTWDADKAAKEAKKLRFDSKLVARMQRDTAAMFKSGWKLGQRHAEIEIDKAKRVAFSLDYNQRRIQLISEEFFKTKSFKVAGDLTNDAKAKIDTIITNGAKTGKTVAEIEAEIYSTFATDGLLAEEVMPLLAGALAGKDIINPQARIDTMVRTNLFEAINEARYSYFTDPALDGFVEALEYSAILDSRTTQICSHLDGQVHATDSSVWNQYRPPNHYNCRSLLVPVTAVDKWTASEPPTLDPQKGFA